MMRTPLRTPTAILVLFLASLVSGLLGCKTKEVIKADPETIKLLTDCKRDKEEKDKYIAKLQEENLRLQVEKGGGGEIVVTIEGGKMTVKAGQPGGTLPIDQRVAAAGAQEFLGMVERSRGAIQKCYEQALKKSAGLQSQKVSLTVYATFNPTGAVASSTSAPSLGEPFDGCFKQVAQKWTVKGSPSPMTYRSVVELTPS
jgi:hypothetical protein